MALCLSSSYVSDTHCSYKQEEKKILLWKVPYTIIIWSGGRDASDNSEDGNDNMDYDSSKTGHKQSTGLELCITIELHLNQTFTMKLFIYSCYSLGTQI